MRFVLLILSLLAGYLLGSISVAVLITRRLGGDVRKQGSGNAGATNVARVYGWKAGLLTLAGDFAKTMLAMLLGSLLAGDAGSVMAAFGCLFGHCFPVFFQFRGGKAVSVSGAIALLLSWKVFAIIFAIFFLMFFATRRVSACSMTAGVGIPVAMLLLGGFPWYSLTLGVFIALFVIYMHRGNLKRIINGTEPKFEAGKKK